MLKFWILVKSIFLNPTTPTSNPFLIFIFDSSDMKVSDFTANECNALIIIIIDLIRDSRSV